MGSLTNFQIQCIDRIIKLLDEFGETYTRDVSQVRYGGENVLDVCFSLYRSGIKVWIYSDEAQFRKEGEIDERFESPDYDDKNILIEKFISALGKHLQTK